MKGKLSLRDVKTTKEICSLGRDHYDFGDWSIMTDGFRVWISKQKIGESRTDHIEVPKQIFDKMIDRYCEPKPIGEWRGDRFYRASTNNAK